MAQSEDQTILSLQQLLRTIHQLRAPGGCPWDRAQTHQSLRPYLIEEAYEVLDAIDVINKPEDLNNSLIKNSFQEELGDVLMQVLLHSEIANETGAFSFGDVSQQLNEKLIRRHPHVFGNIKETTAEQALSRWEKEKAKEKADQINASILDGVPRGLPALQRTARVIEKVTKVGFQWSDLEGPLEKIEEEFSELKTEIYKLKNDPSNNVKVSNELGDLLFSLCNLAYFLKIHPEDALRSTVGRFEKRFKHVERSLKNLGKSPEHSDLNEMDTFWEEAKKIERVQVWGLTGGIASGKSTVAKFFSHLGIPVIDADQLAREISENNPVATEAIHRKFGTNNRAELREIIFNDPEAKKDLEAILHPLIKKESQRRIELLAPSHPIIIYEGTLLIESEQYQNLKGLIVVEAPMKERIQRLVNRDTITLEFAEKIIQSQNTDEFRRKYSKKVLVNDGDPKKLELLVKDLANQLII